MMTGEGRGPLRGVRVVDFTANMSGPFATMMLGDQGAEIIKIEGTNGGDTLRSLGPGVDDVSTYFANLNRSKRSIALDLANKESRPVVEALLDRADVMIHNFRPSAAKKLGLDASRIREGRPGLIYVAIDGFGLNGPYGDRPAYDHVIQALSGFADRQADPKTSEPSLVRQGVIDKATGLTAAQAVTAALFERTRTGEGQVIEVHMLDVAVSFLWPDGMMAHTMLDSTLGWQRPDISKSFRLTKTSDGHLAYALVHARQWTRLTASVGLAPDAGKSGLASEPPTQVEVLRAAGMKLAGMKTVDAVAFISELGIPVAEVVSLADLSRHPQVLASDVLDTFDHPVLGKIRQPNPPARFLNRRAGEMAPAPRLSQHADEVLGEIGFSNEEIEHLRSCGAVGIQPLEGA
jgi:crotonobetainyl-CoA:carnitine CoA-transferase CaiB-like acyl-CoA transferase